MKNPSTPYSSHTGFSLSTIKFLYSELAGLIVSTRRADGWEGGGFSMISPVQVSRRTDIAGNEDRAGERAKNRA